MARLLIVLSGAGCLSLASGNAASAQPSRAQDPASPVQAVAFRLPPGTDLKAALDKEFKRHNGSAAAVLTCVGSLTRAHLRFAGESGGTMIEGPLEILSLVGTLGPDGHHLHLAVADSRGQAFGGHLLEGSPVFTTAEVVLGLLPGFRFHRTHDPRSGYRELSPLPAPGVRVTQ